MAVFLSSTINLIPDNIATTAQIEKAAPNADLCQEYGYGSMVMDQKIYVTFTPLKIYVSGTTMNPGCVLRASNWDVLTSRNLVSAEEMKACKLSMNTYAYTGDINGDPLVECVWESDHPNNLLENANKNWFGPDKTTYDDKPI